MLSLIMEQDNFNDFITTKMKITIKNGKNITNIITKFWYIRYSRETNIYFSHIHESNCLWLKFLLTCINLAYFGLYQSTCFFKRFCSSRWPIIIVINELLRTSARYLTNDYWLLLQILINKEQVILNFIRNVCDRSVVKFNYPHPSIVCLDLDRRLNKYFVNT